MNDGRSASDELIRPEHPAASYDEACERFAELVRRDTSVVDPESRAQLLTPGHRTERAIVFLHGLSNSPRQFGTLAERFIARGYSVLLPRVPYHGYSDRMSTDLAKLTVGDLVDVTAAAVDLAAGLADEVTVSGISLGGVLAVWAAQYRSIAVAAPIAPALGLPMLPYATTGAVFGAIGWLPNRFVWWDPRYKERLPGPTYAYPRFATHALVATQRLGLQLMNAARTEPPRARRIWVISNEADLAVSNSAAATLVRRWQAAGASTLHTFRFPRQLKLFHDLVDPLQPHARPELVHPMLEQIIVDDVAPDVAGSTLNAAVVSSR